MPLAQGNAAKLYCVSLIDRLAADNHALRVLDLGCGDGRNFGPLLLKHPGIAYVGVEPSRTACEQARAALEGLNAEVINDLAHDFRGGSFDVVVSLSVLEHVYRRRPYLECAKANLAPDGRILINYDAGHFVPLGRPAHQRVELWKSRFGKVLARLGQEAHYQAMVCEAEFRSLVAEVGLHILEAKIFNTDLKNVYKTVPVHRRTDFMERWLDFELYLNEVGIEYRDELAPVFRTRNFVLGHAAGFSSF